MKSRLLILLLGCGFLSNTSSFAQTSGFMLLNRLGGNTSKCLGAGYWFGILQYGF